MSSLKSALDDLVQYSKDISDIDIKHSNDILLTITGKRKYLRDATKNEKKLAALYSGDSITKKIKADIASCSTHKGTIKQNIERILRTVNSLNQICNREDIKKRVEDYAQSIEEHQFSIEYIESEYLKNDAEIDGLSHLNDTLTEVNTAEDKEQLRKEIEQEEELIRQYEIELEQKNTKIHKINRMKEIKELEKIRKEKKKPAHKKVDELETLREEIESKQRRIEEYDIMLEDIESRLNRSHTVFDEFRTQCDLLLATRENTAQHDMTSLISILDHILAHITHTTHTSTRHDIRQIVLLLLEYIQNPSDINTQSILTLFPDIHTLDRIDLSPTLQLKAAIIQRLMTDRVMRLVDLSDYVDGLCKQLNTSNTIIYQLVGMDVLVIDRSERESVVKMKLELF